MCVSLLPGILHEPQDILPNRVNEFHPRDIKWILEQALDDLLMDMCEMF